MASFGHYHYWLAGSSTQLVSHLLPLASVFSVTATHCTTSPLPPVCWHETRTGDGLQYVSVLEPACVKCLHRKRSIKMAWRSWKCVWWIQLSLKLPSICLCYGNRVWLMALNLKLPLISGEMATVKDSWCCTHARTHQRQTSCFTLQHQILSSK